MTLTSDLELKNGDNKGVFLYLIQHCFICRPSYSYSTLPHLPPLRFLYNTASAAPLSLIQHCFTCRPLLDDTVIERAGIF
jgi:hypothetical protein